MSKRLEYLCMKNQRKIMLIYPWWPMKFCPKLWNLLRRLTPPEQGLIKTLRELELEKEHSRQFSYKSSSCLTHLSKMPGKALLCELPQFQMSVSYKGCPGLFGENLFFWSCLTANTLTSPDSRHHIIRPKQSFGSAYKNKYFYISERKYLTEAGV